jgi:hypothetical protein
MQKRAAGGHTWAMLLIGFVGIGFPSTAAQLQATAVAISLLPDDAEVRLVPRVRGAIPAPVLPKNQVVPTETDRQVLMSVRFTNGKCMTRGNMNRRKFERLEDIGWIKGLSVNVSDVEYHLTKDGEEARRIRAGDLFKIPHPRTGEQVLLRALRVDGDQVSLVDATGFGASLRRYQPIFLETQHRTPPVEENSQEKAIAQYFTNTASSICPCSYVHVMFWLPDKNNPFGKPLCLSRS